jgi:hypothetical protein
MVPMTVKTHQLTTTKVIVTTVSGASQPQGLMRSLQRSKSPGLREGADVDDSVERTLVTTCRVDGVVSRVAIAANKLGDSELEMTT